MSHVHPLCAFISVIELPRIPAYCPKTEKGTRNIIMPRIRLHNLRHSHVALLIKYLVIADCLGHVSIKVTLGTYGHLYPNKQQEISDILDNL